MTTIRISLLPLKQATRNGHTLNLLLLRKVVRHPASSQLPHVRDIRYKMINAGSSDLGHLVSQLVKSPSPADVQYSMQLLQMLLLVRS